MNPCAPGSGVSLSEVTRRSAAVGWTVTEIVAGGELMAWASSTWKLNVSGPEYPEIGV